MNTEREFEQDIASRAPADPSPLFRAAAALSLPMVPEDLKRTIREAQSPAAFEAACMAFYARAVADGLKLARDAIEGMAVGDLPGGEG